MVDRQEVGAHDSIPIITTSQQSPTVIVRKEGSSGSRQKNELLVPIALPLSRSKSDMNSLSNNVLGKPFSSIREKYSLRGTLGRGLHATVCLCVERRSGRKFACKVINKRLPDGTLACNDLRREVDIMHLLSDIPTVAGLHETYEDAHQLYLVMELCEGGELFERIRLRQRFPEEEAAEVCRAILEAVQGCHTRGVVHRDLKPENILICRQGCDTDIKVADFGSAVRISAKKRLDAVVGSCYYIAPEVLDQSYGIEADVWSVGVILYILLCGMPPFWHAESDGIFEAIRSSECDMQGGVWTGISEGAKDLVQKLLTKNPSQRISAARALDHPWILDMEQRVGRSYYDEADIQVAIPVANVHGNADLPDFDALHVTSVNSPVATVLDAPPWQGRRYYCSEGIDMREDPLYPAVPVADPIPDRFLQGRRYIKGLVMPPLEKPSRSTSWGSVDLRLAHMISPRPGPHARSAHAPRNTSEPEASGEDESAPVPPSVEDGADDQYVIPEASPVHVHALPEKRSSSNFEGPSRVRTTLGATFVMDRSGSLQLA